MNRLFRTSLTTTRSLRNNKIANQLFTESFQIRNKHFYVVQWPNQTVSLRLNQEDESEEDYLNTVMHHAEMQYNALNNVKEKQTQPITINISSQSMKDLSQKLDVSEIEKSERKMSTRNIQLNKVTMVDRFSHFEYDKSVAPVPTVTQKQEPKKKKRSPKPTAAVAELIAIKKEGEPQEE